MTSCILGTEDWTNYTNEVDLFVGIKRLHWLECREYSSFYICQTVEFYLQNSIWRTISWPFAEWIMDVDSVENVTCMSRYEAASQRGNFPLWKYEFRRTNKLQTTTYPLLLRFYVWIRVWKLQVRFVQNARWTGSQRIPISFSYGIWNDWRRDHFNTPHLSLSRIVRSPPQSLSNWWHLQNIPWRLLEWIRLFIVNHHLPECWALVRHKLNCELWLDEKFLFHNSQHLKQFIQSQIDVWQQLSIVQWLMMRDWRWFTKRKQSNRKSMIWWFQFSNSILLPEVNDNSKVHSLMNWNV